MHMPDGYIHGLWGLYYMLFDTHEADECMSVQAQTGDFLHCVCARL